MGTKHDVARLYSEWEGEKELTLIVRCTDRKLEAYVSIDGVVGSKSIRLKYDNDKPVRETWQESVDGTALFSNDPLWLVRNLVNTNLFVFEHEPFGRAARVDKFGTAGMPQLSCLAYSAPDAQGNFKVAARPWALSLVNFKTPARMYSYARGAPVPGYFMSPLRGLFSLYDRLPTACAVGCILSPLRGCSRSSFVIANSLVHRSYIVWQC